ncbi:hypothetical protein [Saezia sanguinis]|uniref:hypothetical protein n=1 Tax=Saezia sanguinis TaxID=1965230 RepID=UPI000F8D3A87|nr:hypothetical protein [Saezia sanguinis]
MISEFNPQAEVASLKGHKRAMRKPRTFKLMRYGSQLLALHAQGATVADLQRWLQKHKITVAHSTISRWLAKHNG